MTSPRFPSVDTGGKLRVKHLPAHTHPATDLSDSTSTGRAVVTAADAAAARTAIGAGTSNLALGATASTAKAGNYTPTVADLPAGAMLGVLQNGDGSWPNRLSNRTDLRQTWIKVVSGSADPAAATSPAVNGAYTGDVVVGV